MKGFRVKGIILSLIAVIALSGMTGAVYAWPGHFGFYPQKACFSYYSPNCQKVDLKIRDQDEWWGNGVTATWTASNMAPGDEFIFDEAFVALRTTVHGWQGRSNLAITCDYDPWSGSLPDHMAKYMEITRCIYRDNTWQMDCLTGTLTRLSGSVVTNDQWRVKDTDNDGKLTFYDLKQSPLTNLPLPFKCDINGARFEMSVRFHQDAGNEFQGNTFTLAMIYCLQPY